MTEHDPLLLQERDGVVRIVLSGQAYEVDLNKVAPALARVGEAATVDYGHAQELSDALNAAESVLHQLANRAAAALAAAEQNVKVVRGRLLLEWVPGQLERLGRDSEDRRKALLDTHPEVATAFEDEVHLRWVLNDLREKKERVHNANRTVLAVLGERRSYHRGSPSGGSNRAPTTGTYGIPRY